MPSKTRVDDLEIDEAPTTINPYTILTVSKDATSDQIKSAYRRLALKHHPDKAKDSEKDSAHKTFQEIAFAYAILSDERRRRRYDATGRTEESLGGPEDGDDEDFDWASYYREQYADVITGDAIKEFAKGYKGSDEERDALLHAYEKHEGKMKLIFEDVMVSDELEDEERFQEIIREAIESGEVQDFNAFSKESEKSRRRRRERAERDGKEAEEHAKDIGVYDKLFGDGKAKGKGKGSAASKGEDGLAALIQQRQKGRQDNFLADLEAKYAPKKKGGKRAAPPMDEPPEEAFERNAKKSSAAESSRKSKRSKA